jgi:3-phenylpropionate/cinnamic acid dioxygenase small subunit
MWDAVLTLYMTRPLTDCARGLKMENRRALSPADRFEIQELLFRFMRSFDEKDWDGMLSCLDETVDCDYSSFRGTPPTTLTRGDYADQRKAALSLLKTQHDLSNIAMMTSGDRIEVKCNFAIRRFHPDFDGSRDKSFHSYGQYQFMVVRLGESWKISSIKQFLLMSDGNPDLHGALQK